MDTNIPIIMIGETGYWKTVLIQKLTQIKNNGDNKKIKILNIHDLTTDKDIINFIKKCINSQDSKG